MPPFDPNVSPADLAQKLPGTDMTVGQAVDAPTADSGGGAGLPDWLTGRPDPNAPSGGPNTIAYPMFQGPAPQPMSFSQGQSITGTIDANGVTPQGGKQISWDDFNGYSPDQQKQILSSMGLNDAQIHQLQGALQKTEMAQFAQYQAKKAQDRHFSTYKGLGPLGALGQQITQTMADVTDGLIGGKGSERLQLKSTQDLQQQSGLADIIKSISGQQNVAQAGAAANQQGILPAGSTAQLNAYTQNYLLPAMKASNDILNQDAMQWGAFTQQFQKQHPSDPIAQILSQQYAAQAPLYDRLLGQNWSQVLSPAYVGQMNKALGAQAATGARSLSEYGTQSTINALAQGAGVGGMSAATPSQIAGGTAPNSIAALFPTPGSYINTTPGGSPSA